MKSSDRGLYPGSFECDAGMTLDCDGESFDYNKNRSEVLNANDHNSSPVTAVLTLKHITLFNGAFTSDQPCQFVTWFRG
jgi:hypothetical protein